MVIKFLVVIIILQSQSRGMLDNKLFFTAIQLSHKYVLSRLEERKKLEPTPTRPMVVAILVTSISARWRVPYAVMLLSNAENLRGITERMKERKKERMTHTRAFKY